jgi:hypothetical protein
MLKRPGSRSNLTLLISATGTIFLLAVLLGGHIILAYLILANFTDAEGMKAVEAFTGLPPIVIWLWVIAGLGIDAWIAHNIRKERKKALQR